MSHIHKLRGSSDKIGLGKARTKFKLLTSLRVSAKRGYCSPSVCVCVSALPVFSNCFNLANEALGATNV